MVPYAAITVPLILGAFVDAPRGLSVAPLPVSAMALLTVVQVGIVTVGLLSCSRYPRHLLRLTLPFAAFLGWAALRSMWNVPDIPAAQNALVYVLFGFEVMLAGTLAANHPTIVGSIVNSGVRFIDYVALGLIALSILRGSLPTDDGSWIVGARAVALLGLVAVSWHVAHWLHGYQSAGMRCAVWVFAILLSLSRTASAIALGFVAAGFVLQMFVSTRQTIVRLPMVLGAGALLLAGVIRYVPLEERFFTGDTSMHVGGYDVNVSGRLDIWPIVIASGEQNPVIGKGLGSSNAALVDLGNIGHPHNDYLKVWHDLGFIGIILLLTAFGSWITVLRRGWRVTRTRSPEVAVMQMAAYLGLLGLMLSALTDNAIVYPFVMGPLGVVIGAGLGVSDPRVAPERTEG